MAERGIDVSYETIRRWVEKFGDQYAKRLRAMRSEPSSTWHVDEVFLRIGGKQMYLWRAVDNEGEVLDILLQSKRNKIAAIRFLRKAIKRAASVPKVVVSDKWRPTGAAVVATWPEFRSSSITDTALAWGLCSMSGAVENAVGFHPTDSNDSPPRFLIG